MSFKNQTKDYSAQVRRSAHEHMINENNKAPYHLYPNTNPNVEMHSGINVYKVRNSQTPNNFLGMKSIRPPPPVSGDRNFNPTPKSGVYIASEHVHLMRTKPVLRQFQNC
jgi:hypothetical protein